MKTINLGGSKYTPVVERVKELHRKYKNSSIETIVLKDDGSTVTVKAIVKIGNRTFTGHSSARYTKEKFGDVAMENAETSSVGRAIGFANIGLMDSIAVSNPESPNKEETIHVCEGCGDPISEQIKNFSKKLFKKSLCRKCQTNKKSKCKK